MKYPHVIFDVEATGLNKRRGAFPYSVATCDLKGKTNFFEWPVDPFSRKVSPKKDDIRLLKRLVNESTPTFHNAKFDINMLELVNVVNATVWRRYDDTILAAHVCNASEVPHRLKDLALKYLDISTADEDKLRKRVISIRNREANHLGWTKGEDIEMDYWMPAAIARLHPELAEPGDATLLRDYNVLDVKRTALLWRMYEKVLVDEGLLEPYKREKRVQKVVYRLENHGVTLRKAKVDQEIARYSKEANRCEAACVKIAKEQFNWPEINIGSGQQLQQILFTNPTVRKSYHAPEQAFGFGLIPTKITSVDEKTNKPRFSTDKHELPKLLREVKELIAYRKTPAAQKKLLKQAETFISNVVVFRKNDKAVTDLSGYLEKAIPTRRLHGRKTDWRLHPSLKQIGTQTTRFSHSDPNVANVSKGDKLDPKDEDSMDFTTREAFGPTWDRLWYAFDYNQLQLRIFAKVAGEEKLIQAFRDGYDAHSFVACQVYECKPDQLDKLMRRTAKAINFGFIFGKSMKTVERELGIPGLATKVHNIFPHAQPYMDKVKAFVRKNGFVETLGGYRLPVPRIRIKGGREIDGSYAGVCYIVQGTEGDIVKNAMIDLDDYLYTETDDDVYMTLQCHDELLFDFPKDGNKHEKRKYLPKNHRRILAEIARLMIKAGADLGVETPVNCERIATDWANGVPQEIGEIYVRRYRKTGLHKGRFATNHGGRNYAGRSKERYHHRLVHKV